jgi:Ca-activated chloride channel family protein
MKEPPAMKRILLAAVLLNFASCAMHAPGASRDENEPPSTAATPVEMLPPPPPDAKPAKPSDPAKHERKTPVDFEQGIVDGEVLKPESESTEGRETLHAGLKADPSAKAPPRGHRGDGKDLTVSTPSVPPPEDVAPTGGEKSGKFSGMYLQHYGVNPTIEVSDEPVSTFAADVDTGSYTLARAWLNRGELPNEAAVRVEEFVNAFDYSYRPPETEAFAVQVEMFPSPNRKGYHVLHLGLKGKEIRAEERKPANLIFTIDVSGSMSMESRLTLAKRALELLVDQLEAKDSVAIVVYGDEAHVVLPPTPATQREKILGAIGRLRPEGSTNVQAGLELVYAVALKGFKPGGINRVILCSDGVANNGVTTADGIFARVKARASEGITLSTVGFGMGNYNDVLMERLADQGDGNYAYVDRLEEAKRIFVEQLTGTLEVIAKDVKLQLEFNPAAVERYRLIGFENRMLDKRDFANDKVDAGEIGAGHSVTALYEVKLKTRDVARLATFRARFKQPDGHTSALVEKALPMSIVRDDLKSATGPARLSLVAAGFAEKLRGSYWARNLKWDELLAMWEQLPPPLKERKQVAELRQLMLTARRLDARGDRFEKEVPVASMDFDRVPVLR